ncbi:unnamed protein product [Ilex paraguariensis]|uniref:Uncharacterized protein n=1 Tax=Ilex paraguariensis TaxID=185542 RepID=A0ABC8RDQ3_9AQUA
MFFISFSFGVYIVTKQALRSVPPDGLCMDKFLIQSTVVPVGTTGEDITSSMFDKDNGKYVQENKLKVILGSPPHSLVLSPINGTLKQDAEESKVEFKAMKDVEELKLVKDVEEIKSKLNTLEIKLTKAEATILKLIEERRLIAQEGEILRQELVMLLISGKITP